MTESEVVAMIYGFVFGVLFVLCWLLAYYLFHEYRSSKP